MNTNSHNYSKSRILATFLCYQHEFRIVRKRWNGKYWSMYPRALCAVFNGVEISGERWAHCGTNPLLAAQYFRDEMYKWNKTADEFNNNLKLVINQ